MMDAIGWLTRFARRMLMLLRHGQFDADLEEEMRLHQELREQEQVERGVSPEEAHYAAQRHFGNNLVLREESRDMWGWNWLETLLQDIRFALRMLRKSPGFTAVAVLTLALGIGANTAIFTLIGQVMLKSLSVSKPGQLYRLGSRNDCCVTNNMESRGWDLFPYSMYKDFRDHTPEFSELAAFQAMPPLPWAVRRLHSSALAKPFRAEFVSGNYFQMFSIRIFAGRALTPQDDHAGARPVAVMSYRAWQQDFGLDPSVVGGTFVIDTVPFTLVGIAPPRFFGDRLQSDPPDFWLPLSTEPVLDAPASIRNGPDEWLYAIGRLKPGAHPQQVQAQLTVELRQWLNANIALISTQWRKEVPRQFVTLAPGGAGVRQMESDYASGLRLLMVLAGVVLLIACANIANFLLARGAAGRLNTAIRVALGAPRRRLIRQVLTESVLVAIFGGVIGLYVAYAGARACLLLAFRGSQYVPLSASPSWLVLGFAFALSLITGVVFGLIPAWMNSRSNPSDVLRGAGRSTGDHASFARRALVVLQVGLCVVLLASAGLLTESLRNLQDQPYGFQTQCRWIAHVDPQLAGIKPDQLQSFYQQLGPQLDRIPGVLSASYSLYSPMEGNNWNSAIFIEGRPQWVSTSWLRIGPHYFETIGTPLIRGRTITKEDTRTSQRVVVVNQAFARKFFPHYDPIGQHFGFNGPRHAGDYEIVGVVGNAIYQDARQPAWPTAFIPFLQDPNYRSHDERLTMLRSDYMGRIELLVAGKPANLEAHLRRALANINPNLTALHMQSFGEQPSLNFNQDRLMARLTELFGLLALLLACVGTYSVTSYSVARRTNEIGIRMALGAGRKSILALILRSALAQIALGLIVGVPAALACGRLLASSLYGVKPTDPLTFVVVSVILAAVALLACYIPDRRASRVDPMVALRYE